MIDTLYLATRIAGENPLNLLPEEAQTVIVVLGTVIFVTPFVAVGLLYIGGKIFGKYFKLVN